MITDEMVEVAAKFVRDTHEAVRAALEAADAAAWQPIETAPKDATKILAFGLWAGQINGPDEVPTVQIALWSDGRSDYPGFAWNVVGTDAYAAWIKPTHWRPLPGPPPMPARTADEMEKGE